jgi:hypothetical protein
MFTSPYPYLSQEQHALYLHISVGCPVGEKHNETDSRTFGPAHEKKAISILQFHKLCFCSW